MTRRFIRECQECGRRIMAVDPSTLKGGMTDAYRNRKCPSCKSEAFDYGSPRDVDDKLNDIPQDYTADE